MVGLPEGQKLTTKEGERKTRETGLQGYCRIIPEKLAKKAACCWKGCGKEKKATPFS